MKNLEVAELLKNIAQLLEIKGELVFKIRAYERAALTIKDLDEDIEDVWKKGRLGDIPGVGKALTKKISEFLERGKLDYYEKLKKSVPVKVEELGRVEGLGPKTILKLYKKYNIKNLKDLGKAAKQGKIQKLEGLGPIVEKNILKRIEFAKSTKKRLLLRQASAIAEEVKAKLKNLKEINKIEIAGSLRRRKDTIGDVDILITSSNPKKVMDFFVQMKGVKDILAKGITKSSVKFKKGMQVDLRIIDADRFGAALLYFTGSKQHNIKLRKIAIKKGMKLSEYGVFDKKTDKLLASKTEKDCYKKLGLKYVKPKLREE
jgi:DNA polymerase (family 10)